jgi:hypothetical protein
MAADSSREVTVTQLIERRPGCMFVAHGNVLIVIWTAQGTGPLIDELARVTAAFARKYPRGFSSVHVISKGLPLATSEARDRLLALIRRYGEQLACVGTVLEGSGFWASATRSFIVGLHILSPTPLKLQIYASAREVAAWLVEPHAQRTGVIFEPQEIERAIMQFRE